MLKTLASVLTKGCSNKCCLFEVRPNQAKLQEDHYKVGQSHNLFHFLGSNSTFLEFCSIPQIMELFQISRTVSLCVGLLGYRPIIFCDYIEIITLSDKQYRPKKAKTVILQIQTLCQTVFTARDALFQQVSVLN